MANRKNAFYSVVVAVFFILIVFCDASSIEVEVYRLIQYDMNGVPFGCRVASLNRFAASSISAPPSVLSRTAVILYLREFYENENYFMREYIEGGKPLGGLLILLPQVFRLYNPRTTLCDCDFTVEKKQLMDLEQKLIHSTIKYPVYFAFEHRGLAKVLAAIRKNNADDTIVTNGYKLVVTSPTPKKLASPTIINIQGWLPGLKADGDSNQLPTIAIVASYDTFGAAPALSVGSDSNGSGVVALLAIARIFSKLYSNASTRGRYNILFGLTSGGPYNYAGTQKWLRSFDQRLRESIDYAICLNSLGSMTTRLWLHVSNPPENAYVKQIFEGLSNIAKELDINVGLKHKEINVSNTRVAWEHEHFSRLRVPAATISRLTMASNLLENTGGIYDKREFAYAEEVANSVTLVAQSLVRHIYGQEEKNINIFPDKSSLLANYHHIGLWLDLLSKTHRVAPFLSNDDAIITALKKELTQHVEVNNTYDVVDDGMFTFYDSTVNTLLIHQAAGVTHGLFWQLILVAYLLSLCILPVVAGVQMISLVYSVSLYLAKFMKNN